MPSRGIDHELGDVACRVHVTVHHQPTGRAPIGSLRQQEAWVSPPARRAHLGRRSPPVDDPWLRSVPGRLVGELAPQLAESAIQNPAVEPSLRSHVPPRRIAGAARAGGQAGDVQVLDPDHRPPGREPLRDLVQHTGAGGQVLITLVVDDADAQRIAAYSTANRVAVVETTAAVNGAGSADGSGE